MVLYSERQKEKGFYILSITDDMLARQFRSWFSLLLVAAILSFFLHDPTDAIIILVIVLASALLAAPALAGSYFVGIAGAYNQHDMLVGTCKRTALMLKRT